jgi:mono/diheme cytochrome c family protein
MKTLAAFLALTAAGSAETAPGVASEARAKMNWMLHCQGCHQPNATGSAGGAPSMAGDVARFLGVEGGREYLTRVPGVANAGLDNAQLAELLNWTLSTFDKSHLPGEFAPFTADEIATGRARPLVSDAALMREALRKRFPASEKTKARVGE